MQWKIIRIVFLEIKQCLLRSKGFSFRNLEILGKFTIKMGG